MTVTLEIKGLDQLIGKLENLSQLRTVKAGLKGAGVGYGGHLYWFPADGTGAVLLLAGNPGAAGWRPRAEALPARRPAVQPATASLVD